MLYPITLRFLLDVQMDLLSRLLDLWLYCPGERGTISLAYRWTDSQRILNVKDQVDEKKKI